MTAMTEPAIDTILRHLANAHDLARRKRLPMRLRHALYEATTIAFGIQEKVKRRRK